MATSVQSCVAGPIRILVVDDSRPFRRILHRLLTSFSGLTVVGEAEDGQSAIEMASRLGPQVITMDMQMPRLGGVEATRRIKKALPEVHVIGLSLQDDIVTREVMEMVGCLPSQQRICRIPFLKLLRKLLVAKSLKKRFVKVCSDPRSV